MQVYLIYIIMHILYHFSVSVEILSTPRPLKEVKTQPCAKNLEGIKDLQESDGGEYLCQVLISRINRVTANVNLLVRRPPYILDNSTRTVVVSAGEPVKLECYAGGVPIPTISWRRENNALLPTGGSIFKGNILQIQGVNKEDRGTYYCIADNGVGRGDRRNINVEVQFAPVVEATRPRVYQAVQYDTDLECHVEAYPPAAIVWIFRQESIVNNRDYRVSQFTTADEFTDTTLRVITIEQNQYGNYSCRATNKLGQSHSTVELIQHMTPVCPPACGHLNYSGVTSVTEVTATVTGVLVSALSVVWVFRRLH